MTATIHYLHTPDHPAPEQRVVPGRPYDPGTPTYAPPPEPLLWWRAYWTGVGYALIAAGLCWAAAAAWQGWRV